MEMASLFADFHVYSTFLFFLTSMIIPIFLIFFFFFLRLRVCCSCEICQTYIQSAWKSEFPNLCDWYTHLLKNSPTRTVHIHVLNNTITANPDNVEYMLKTRFDNFPKGKPFSAILGDFLGRGIFNVDGDSWRFQRKPASVELNRVSIRAYWLQVVNQEIYSRLLPLMDSVAGGDRVIDLQEVFRRFSFDCICRFSFGLDPKCLELSLPLSEFAVAFDLASKLSAERAMAAFPVVWRMKKLLNIGSEKKLQEAIRTVHVVALDIIRQRQKLGFLNQRDLLSKFMSSINDETYLRDIIVSFLLAGRDTIASALTSLFWLVACHPEVETAILQEVEKLPGENSDSGMTTYEELGELHYLTATVYEGMRLYPPIQFDSKFCQENDQFPDGSFLKRGTRVTYHPYAMGRMEEIWGSDCLEFKPERWVAEGRFIPDQNPFRNPVFQAGIRVCLGKEIAIVQLKAVAISLLRRFGVELARPDLCCPRFSPGLTATFQEGLPVRIRARGLGVNLS